MKGSPLAAARLGRPDGRVTSTELRSSEWRGAAARLGRPDGRVTSTELRSSEWRGTAARLGRPDARQLERAAQQRVERRPDARHLERAAKQRVERWVLQLLIAILLGAAAPLAAQSPVVGDIAPSVSVPDLDGKPVRIGLGAGKRAAVVEFWATWCELCRALLPSMRAAQRQYGDRVDFFGVNVTVNERKDRVRQYVTRNQPPFVTVYDERGVAVRAFGAVATSHVVIIDARGRVAYIGDGADQNIPAELAKVVASAQDSGADRLRLTLDDAVRVGQIAPAIVLPYATSDSAGPASQPFDLAKELGRVVVLIFYAGDTIAAALDDWRAIASHEQRALDAGVVVVGISADRVDEHVRFARSLHLPFKLVSDSASLVARRYGAARGRRARPTVVVIGRDGRVRYVDSQFAPRAAESYVHLDAAVRAAREN